MAMQITAARVQATYAPSNNPTAASARGHSGNRSEPTAPEQAQIEKLKARDREVRAHEQAHLSAAGSLAVSGASFTYERGPDGINYAVGGEVNIRAAEGRTPEETLSRAEQIRAAALAPAKPSGQDRAVAAAASQMALQARAELAQTSSGGQDRQQEKVSARYGNDFAPKSSLISTYA